MNSNDIKVGLRVDIEGRTALVVGRPEYYTPRAKLIRIKYENSTRYEYKLSHQLVPLPTEEQYPTHGGSFVKPEGHF